MKKSTDPRAFDAEGMKAPLEVRRLCLKVAEQAGKEQWWNAMAYATQLVAECQRGCGSVIEKVAKKRALQKPASKKKKKKKRSGA